MKKLLLILYTYRSSRSLRRKRRWLHFGECAGLTWSALSSCSLVWYSSFCAYILQKYMILLCVCSRSYLITHNRKGLRCIKAADTGRSRLRKKSRRDRLSSPMRMWNRRTVTSSRSWFCPTWKSICSLRLKSLTSNLSLGKEVCTLWFCHVLLSSSSLQ